jgi:tetratricopeptide (TPR) repeat protein
MKKKHTIVLSVALFFAFGLPLPAPNASVAGEDTGDLMVRAMRLLDDTREVEALKLFEALVREEPDHYEALLNAAFLHLRQGWLYSDKEGQKEHYFKLRDYARRAVNQNPMEYRAKLIHLVAKAKTAGYLSRGDQVRIARELQQELEALVASGKNDPDAIYILSWLNFKVGRLGSLEKLLASVLFGGLPDTLTTDKAVELMQKAMALRPDYSIYHYDLGLFRQRLGQTEKARSLFEKVLSMEPKKPEELVYRQWAQQRLNELVEREMAGN